MAKQLVFEFVEEIDQKIAKQAEADRIEMKHRNHHAILEWHVREYPPENEEWDIILMGIRLDRHVHGDECDQCNLGYYDHCPPYLPMHWSERHKQWLLTKVCLKDFLAKCKEWGINPEYLGGPEKDER